MKIIDGHALAERLRSDAITTEQRWQANLIAQVIEDMPEAQSEITEDDVKEFCRKRCLRVVTSDLYNKMARRWKEVRNE